MKKVINGMVYNTETATMVAEVSRGNRGDFRAAEDTLYLTAKGAFFSTFASFHAHDGNGNTGWGTRMDSLSLDEAVQWLDRNDVDLDDLDPKIVDALHVEAA